MDETDDILQMNLLFMSESAKINYIVFPDGNWHFLYDWQLHKSFDFTKPV